MTAEAVGPENVSITIEASSVEVRNQRRPVQVRGITEFYQNYAYRVRIALDC